MELSVKENLWAGRLGRANRGQEKRLVRSVKVFWSRGPGVGELVCRQHRRGLFLSRWAQVSDCRPQPRQENPQSLSIWSAFCHDDYQQPAGNLPVNIRVRALMSSLADRGYSFLREPHFGAQESSLQVLPHSRPKRRKEEGRKWVLETRRGSHMGNRLCSTSPRPECQFWFLSAATLGHPPPSSPRPGLWVS